MKYLKTGLVLMGLLCSASSRTTNLDNSGQIEAVKTQIGDIQKKLDALALAKGHDVSVTTFLTQTTGMLDQAKSYVAQGENMLPALQAAQDQVKAVQDQFAQLEKQRQAQEKEKQLQVEQLNKQLKGIFKNISNTLIGVEGIMKIIDQMAVSGPKTYPERCFIMVTPEKIAKEGFETLNGIVEQFNRNWVLSTADPKASDGLRRVELDDKVGLIGSKDQSAGIIVRSLTPAGMSVSGLVDPKTGTVMCVSQAKATS